MFTLPAGAVAKYCYKHVCVCVSVCRSASMSPEPHARYLSFFVHVAYGHDSVLLRQGDKILREMG